MFLVEKKPFYFLIDFVFKHELHFNHIIYWSLWKKLLIQYVQSIFCWKLHNKWLKVVQLVQVFGEIQQEYGQFS